MSAFITIEGIEGCGKSTQARRLESGLRAQGHDVVLTREPGGSNMTREIRRLLSDPNCRLEPRAELLLFLADRAQHVASVVRPALERGAVVICDRYSDSTVAYQCHGRGHDVELVLQLNDWAALGLQPDLTLWIDCDVETGLGRARRGSGGPGDRFEAEPMNFHEAVREGFAQQHRAHPTRIIRVDGNLSEDLVTQAIADVTADFLARSAS